MGNTQISKDKLQNISFIWRFSVGVRAAITAGFHGIQQEWHRDKSVTKYLYYLEQGVEFNLRNSLMKPQQRITYDINHQ